jgi:hypothetical protein
VVLVHETAEKVRAGIRSPVSRQHICFDRCSEGRSAAVWTSRFCVDRIAAGEIDFFSGLPHQRHAGVVTGGISGRRESACSQRSLWEGSDLTALNAEFAPEAVAYGLRAVRVSRPERPLTMGLSGFSGGGRCPVCGADVSEVLTRIQWRCDEH